MEQRPEETRVMLEEAAGITKYRKKVEISQRKIELTEANLQRVEDILGEIQAQERSLKRQAAKARRYKSLSGEIQDLEIHLYSNSYAQLEEELGTRADSTETLVREEISRSTGVAHIQALIEQMNLELDEKDAGLSVLRNDHLRLSDAVRKKEGEIESLSSEIRMIGELKVRLTAEQESLMLRVEELKANRRQLEDNREEIQERSSEIEREIAVRDERATVRKRALEEIREEYERARTELSAGENREVGLSHESGYLNRLLEQISDSRSRLEKELSEIKVRSESIVKVSERKGLVREATAERLKEIEAAIEAESAGSKELVMMKGRLESDLKSAESDLNVCQSRLSTLETLTENFEGYQMGVRTIMKARDFPPLQAGRILGILADVIQVAPEYERAVEAVLAEKLQYVLVASEKDGKDAVAYLRQSAKGMGSFAPVSRIRAAADRGAGELGLQLLRDQVSTPPAYEPLVDALLGDTAIAVDLDTAMTQWERARDLPGRNGCGIGFVTLDGDRIDHQGIISGGRASHGSRGLLIRKREMTELKEGVAGHTARVRELQGRLEEISAGIEEKQRVLHGLTEDRWSCQEEINELDKVLFRLGQELDQLEKMSAKISEDLQRKEIERNKHEKDLVRIADELGMRKTQKEREEAFFREKERELREAEAEFEQCREDVAKLRTDLRILKENERSTLREIEMMAGYVEDSLERLQKIEEDIGSGLEKREACLRRKAMVEDELRGLRERLQKAEADVNRADTDRKAFQSRIREEQNKEETLKKEVDDLREQINRARMENSEVQFKMNHLMETVRDKFNLHLPDIYRSHLQEDFSRAEAEERVQQKRRLREQIGEVNLTAIKELEALNERQAFIVAQKEDLVQSIESLRSAIRKINRTSLEKFRQTFQDVDAKLKEIFPILFNGGTAGLKLVDESHPLESGVLVEVQPPGKKLSHMGLLSGGEKALVAMALIFAIYMIKPSPFCLLDEVDSPLDEANIDRFNKLLTEIRRA
ncbi:MAG: chromosome segregation protein SMC, partial [Actinomycetota bacterium]|nr:chromosome segregation protein SMC [Actinomycetota bacterium]